MLIRHLTYSTTNLFFKFPNHKKIMKKILFSFLVSIFLYATLATSVVANNPSSSANFSPKWGKSGHRIVGEIAQRYLSKKAKKNLQKILGDTTLAYVGNWMDEIKSDKSYPNMGAWHYINIDEGQEFKDLKRNPKGDILTAIDQMKTLFNKPNASKYDKSFALKALVHLVGDIHQPMHVGHKSDKGANDVKVKWFREDSNLHRVWDSNLIDYQQLSFTEFADKINHPTEAQVQRWQASNPQDWMLESHKIATKLYAGVGDGNFYYNYAYTYTPVVQERLLQAGIRLAAVLNNLLE
jgi:hypothetical protein